MPAGAPKKDPALKKNPVTVKLPQWLLDWTGARTESRAKLIEDALCEKHGLKPPRVKEKK